MMYDVFYIIDYFIKSGLLWGIRLVKSLGYAFEITDPHMKVIFYSYLSQYNRLVEEFLYGDPKPDIWQTLPTAKILGMLEIPVPHLLYRDYNMPPFTNDPLFLVLVDRDLYSYSRMSYARKVVRDLIEPFANKVREDYLNLIIIDTRRGVDESIGGILGGLILRSLGLLVDLSDYPGHGLYLKSEVSRKYPDIMAWKTSLVDQLKESNLLECGAFLPELSVINLYGSPPCQNLSIELPTSPDPGNLIVVGEVEPSYKRIHSGLKQVGEYDRLGYSDISLIIAPEACKIFPTSCIDLEPPPAVKFTISNRTNVEKKNSLSEIFDYITYSTLILNIHPEKLLRKYKIENWHNIVSMPLKLDLIEILSLIDKH